MIEENKYIEEDKYAVVGVCKTQLGEKCGLCCVKLTYDIPNQPESIPPKRGWCEHLDPKTMKCKIYDTRPEGCRVAPTVRDLLWNFPKECSYTLKRVA